MNFKELREKYNISDEDINLLNETYVTADSFNALNGKYEASKNTIKGLKDDLKNFEGVDVKGLNDKIQAYETDIANQKADYEKKISQMAISNFIAGELKDCKHMELLKSRYDLEGVKVNASGEIENPQLLQAQTNKFKEAYKDFWGTSLDGFKPFNGGAEPERANKYAWDKTLNTKDNTPKDGVVRSWLD